MNKIVDGVLIAMTDAEIAELQHRIQKLENEKLN